MRTGYALNPNESKEKTVGVLKQGIVALALFLALSAMSGEARAATITVTNLNDSGAGSLRQAITDAAASDAINFGVAGTITLTSGELAISKNLTITGPGASNLAISGNNASRVFSVTGGTVLISGLSITGGNTTSGGGIYNNGGTVTVSNCVITGNVASSYGGGVMSETALSIVSSTVANNTASQGGGLFVGGAGNMTVTGSTIAGNSSTGSGGGIRNYGTCTVTGSTLSGNTTGSAGGGVSTSGTLSIAGSTLSGNTTDPATNGGGGGIAVLGGTTNITASTISGNSAPWGGAIYNYATLNVNHSTINGNSSSAAYSGGLDNDNSGTATVTNTILAGDGYTDCAGTIISNDYNLIQDFSPYLCTISGSTTHDIRFQNPILGPLQNNGGPTNTHALLTGSPAIDHGNCAAGADQRGIVRPTGAGCDIGAFEVNTLKNLAVSKAGPGTGIIDSNTSGGVHCGATCASDFGEGAGVTLTAAPDAGSVFMGWSNGSGPAAGCAGTGSCIFTLSADAAVTANFKLTQTVSVTQSVPATALAGSSFQVTATASSGLDISITTTGACTGSGTNSATITMLDTAGDCAVHYNQAGDATYEPAPEVVEHARTGKCTVTISNASANGSWNGGVWAPSGPGAVVAASEIDALLNAGTPVTITTVVSAGGTICDTDDITVAADIATAHASPSLDFSMGGGFSLINGARVTLSGSSPSLSIGGVAYAVINDLNALQNMSANLAGRYALGSDIDATATSGWNSGAGFAPVGTSLARFTGVFDGLGHTIDGLFINRGSSDYQGLFGYVDNAVLRNLGLTNAAATGRTNVGSLAGYSNSGAVINCYADTALSCYSSCGGLVGYNNNGAINKSWVSGSVSATQNIIGGIAGYNKGTIDNSHSDSGVVGANDVGGLAGIVGGTVSNSYATGSVSGTNRVGGLVGSSIVGRGVPPGAVSNCYSSGSVTGTSNVGGLAGAGVTVTNSYWDTQTSGQASSAGGGTGVTTSGMMTQANLTGFDFVNTWWMVEGDTRPFLRSEYSLHIISANQLQLMSLDPAAGYLLERDIDLASALTNTSGAGGSSSALWGASGFVPVGDVGAGGFLGTFDGNGHIISDLTINRPAFDYVGLFGQAGGATLRNVGLTNVAITGHSAVGALAGRVNTGAAISASYVEGGSVNGYDSVGALVGVAVAISTISNSYSDVSLTGEGQRVGGLVGVLATDASITNCYAAGHVTGASGIDVGGLVGANLNGWASNSFWNYQTTGQNSSALGSGITTAQMQSISTFSGWSIDDAGGTGEVWRIYEGHTYPLLRVFLQPLTVTADNMNKSYDGASYSGGLVNPVYSIPGAETSGHLLGLADPYGSAVNVGLYPPDLWSDQQGFDILYTNALLTIGKADQTISVTQSAPATTVFNETFAVSATSDSGLSVDITTTGSCSGSGTGAATITMTSGTGTCAVHYNQAGDFNYASANEVTEARTAQKAAQSPLSFNAGSPLIYSTTETLAAAGGSGTGSVTYQVTSGSCTITGAANDQLMAGSGTGACTVAATKAADTNYSEATASATVILQKAPQALLTLNADSPLSYPASETLTTAGGSGTGAVSYQVVSGSCSVVGDKLTANSGTGTCSIQAIKNSDADYIAAVASATVTLTINQYKLTITKAGTGSGTVTAAGIDCGPDCRELYDYKTVVTLTATPGAGSTFAGWSGDADCADGSVMMGTSKTCSATFTMEAISVPNFWTSDPGIPGIEREDGGSDGNNLLDGNPNSWVRYIFMVNLMAGETPQNVRVVTNNCGEPLYPYDMTCTGDFLTGAACRYETQLGPTSGHSFYFEAVLADGAVIRYPVTGFIAGPVVELMNGYNMVGIPKALSGEALDGMTAFGTGHAYRWSSSGLTQVINEGDFVPVDNTRPVRTGEGYYVERETLPTLPGLSEYPEVVEESYEITLSPGWNIISNPYGGSVRLADTRLRRGSDDPLSWLEASSRGLAENVIYHYKGSDFGDGFVGQTAGGDPEGVLVPWLGYWLYLNSTDAAILIVPRP